MNGMTVKEYLLILLLSYFAPLPIAISIKDDQNNLSYGVYLHFKNKGPLLYCHKSCQNIIELFSYQNSLL